MPKLDCQRAGDLILDFLEDGLAPDLEHRMRKHFANCPPCLAFLESYKKTTDLCRRTLVRDIPADVSDRLMSFLRTRTRNGA